MEDTPYSSYIEEEPVDLFLNDLSIARTIEDLMVEDYHPSHPPLIEVVGNMVTSVKLMLAGIFLS